MAGIFESLRSSGGNLGMSLRRTGSLSAPDRAVNLTRSNPRVVLNDDSTVLGVLTGTLTVNLAWSDARAQARSTPGRGFIQTLSASQPTERAEGVDLDLGCMWQMTDGKRGVVQSLGHRNGSFPQPPYVYLDVDDQSGGTGGENLFVNLDRIRKVERLLFFAYVTTPDRVLEDIRAVVTMTRSAGPPIVIALDTRAEGQHHTCAVATLRHEGEQVIVEREVRYFRGYQQSLDRRYGFGMQWIGWEKHGAYD